MKKYIVFRNGEHVRDRGSKIILADTVFAAIDTAKAIYADDLAAKDSYAEVYDYYYRKSENAEYTAEEQK